MTVVSNPGKNKNVNGPRVKAFCRRISRISILLLRTAENSQGNDVVYKMSVAIIKETAFRTVKY